MNSANKATNSKTNQISDEFGMKSSTKMANSRTKENRDGLMMNLPNKSDNSAYSLFLDELGMYFLILSFCLLVRR